MNPPALHSFPDAAPMIKNAKLKKIPAYIAENSIGRGDASSPEHAASEAWWNAKVNRKGRRKVNVK